MRARARDACYTVPMRDLQRRAQSERHPAGGRSVPAPAAWDARSAMPPAPQAPPQDALVAPLARAVRLRAGGAQPLLQRNGGDADVDTDRRDGVAFELSETFLRRIGMRSTGGNHWQRDINGRGDHISMFHTGRRLEGSTARNSTYWYSFRSFHVTFVVRNRGNIQFHWRHIGGRVWEQAGHTSSHLIRQWGEDPADLERLARREAYLFIHDDLGDIDTIDVEEGAALA